MRFSILGPVVVTDGGEPVALPTGPAGAVVCWLAANAGEPVSWAALARVAWPDPPPESRVKAVVRTVRDRLGDVVTVTAGHATLHAAPADIDARAFEAALEQAADRSELESALALWRGDPCPEVAGSVVALPMIERLVSRRREATERLFALRLAGPVDYRLVADLRGEVVRSPDRAPLRHQLAVALYRTGRQVEALDTLGGLRAEDAVAAELYDAILRHDPSLDGGDADPGQRQE